MTATDLFLEMCKLTTGLHMGHDACVYSIPYLAGRMSQSKYRVRKCMKKLEAVGLVQKDYEGGLDDWYGYAVYCHHGWSLTAKACKTAIYMRIEKETNEEIEEWLSRAYLESK